MQTTMRVDGARRQFRTVRDAVWHCNKIGGSAKLVALRLVEHLPDAFPSLDTLSGWTGLSVRTIRSALRELERVEVISTQRNVRGRSNVYAFAFVGVSIPELGRADLPPAPPSDGPPPPADGPRQNLPPSAGDTTPAESAGVGGENCRPGRQPLPPKQDPKLTNKRERDPRGSARGARPVAAIAPPLVFTFRGWECSPALRAELVQMGVPAARIDARLRALRNRPVNGGAGVVSLDDYVRENAERWVVWEAERLAQTPYCSGGNGVSSAFARGGANPGATWAPEPKCAAYCAHWKIDLTAIETEFRRRGEPLRLGGGSATDAAFRKLLEHEARKAMAARTPEPRSSGKAAA